MYRICVSNIISKKRVPKQEFHKALYNVQNVACQERSKCYIEPQKGQ